MSAPIKDSVMQKGESTRNIETSGYKPQWRYQRDEHGKPLKTIFVRPENGDGEDWTDVDIVYFHGTATIRVGNVDVPMGAPWPRWNGDVLQAAYLFGHAQAQALAWSLAAHTAAAGDEIEVRVEKFSVSARVDVKCIPPAPQSAAETGKAVAG